ncbi:MAG: NAD(+)/NADH kinase, partial [Actinomycetospora chiangmaiensis]|nr:NAD(+)/NADH kinase [Actinomycetospora chiangmaiensis]
MRNKSIAFVASPTRDAREAAALLMRRYEHVPPEEADVVVALGGDGLMLQVLHRFMDAPKPIYGMNRGTVGFLMNEFGEDDLRERLEKAQRSVIHPLLMQATDTEGRAHTARAINEVYLL